MPFSTWSNDSSWNPTIFTGNQKVRVNTIPRLLGVILDRSLMFNARLKKLTASLASSIRIIRVTAYYFYQSYSLQLQSYFLGLAPFHTDNGLPRFGSQQLNYAAPAWQPWLSDTNLSSLDRLQNHSLRLITNQLVSSPLEALRLEADV